MKQMTRGMLVFSALLLSFGTSVYAETPASMTAEAAPDAQETALYSYEGTAEELYDIGILKGDGVNFNLKQIPDRLQSAVMTVRMLGKEAEALSQYEAGEISCIFTDIADTENWAKPYLAWLYANGITLGIGDGKFGNGTCTAQMYCTFMLRALGYKDTGDAVDFVWDQALSFAEEKALYDQALKTEVFSRGSMAAVTYQTLAADLKGMDISLLEKLIADGAVPADGADLILDKLAAFDALDAQLSAIRLQPCTAVKGRIDVSTAYRHEENDSILTESVISWNADLLYRFDEEYGEALSMTGMMRMTDPDMSADLPFGIWKKDGVLYSDMYQEKQYASMDEISSLHSLLGKADADGSVIGPIALPYYAVDNLYTEDTGDSICVTFDISQYLAPTAASVFGIQDTYGALADHVFDISAEYAVNKTTGALEFYTIHMMMGAQTTDENGTVSTKYHQMTYQLNLEASEDAVVYPDFAEYQAVPLEKMPLDMLVLPF